MQILAAFVLFFFVLDDLLAMVGALQVASLAGDAGDAGPKDPDDITFSKSRRAQGWSPSVSVHAGPNAALREHPTANASRRNAGDVPALLMWKGLESMRFLSRSMGIRQSRPRIPMFLGTSCDEWPPPAPRVHTHQMEKVPLEERKLSSRTASRREKTSLTVLAVI